MIEVVSASKKYGENTVLDAVNMIFHDGKTYGIIGRNGSGKTILLKCICGLTPLTSGEISIDGKVIGKDVDSPPKLGMIIEEPGFLPTFSGFSNLKMLASIKGEIDADRIKETMRIVGLDPYDKKHVGCYSMGMRQRLGIAQAIMEEPLLLILDEPMNGLDESGVKEMRDVFSGLKDNGTTILMATHNRDDVEILCDVVLEIKNGHLYEAM